MHNIASAPRNCLAGGSPNAAGAEDQHPPLPLLSVPIPSSAPSQRERALDLLSNQYAEESTDEQADRLSHLAESIGTVQVHREQPHHRTHGSANHRRDPLRQALALEHRRGRV
jgi:hypothetical protein